MKRTIQDSIAIANNKNTQCLYIARSNAKLTLEHLNSIAVERNGKCLSTQYINNKSKYEWECKFGHKWFANADNIKKGKWCPICRRGLGEETCRQLLEDLFGKDFKKIKPDWLQDPNTGYNLELDGYCAELGIAFEHNGRQHYALTEYTKTQEDLENIQRKDKLKKELCEKNNVKLIVIPQVPDQIKFNSLKEFILKQCEKFNIINKIINYNAKINYNISPRVIKMLAKFKNIAISHGGKCLSDMYVHDKYKLDFECQNGHKWLALPTNVNKGHWCKICVSKNYIDKNAFLIKCQNIAKKNYGICTSKEYIDSHTKLTFVCKNQHVFCLSPNGLISGKKWCKFCKKSKKYGK